MGQLVSGVSDGFKSIIFFLAMCITRSLIFFLYLNCITEICKFSTMLRSLPVYSVQRKNMNML